MNDIAELHIIGGRYQATCARCLRHSVLVRADDSARAWSELLKVGWTLDTRQTVTGHGYVRCPTCTNNPMSVDVR